MTQTQTTQTARPIPDPLDPDVFNEKPTGTVWPALRFSVPSMVRPGMCAECGGCTDSQDMEARQMGVACVCDRDGEEEGR